MMYKRLISVLGFIAILLPVLSMASPINKPAPEFTHTLPAEWIGSVPLRVGAFRGKVVLLDFWTFDCWNCYRSFPWLNKLEAEYAGKGLQVLGVHAPEFEHERDPQKVAQKIREFGLQHPTMIDNDFSYWRALENRYWPSFYLIDKHGYVRNRFIGEIHQGDRQALEIERQIQGLLAED